ncbi:MAG: hypothetical protein NVSMB4_00630 [Acidimicrobiales bacterium]
MPVLTSLALPAQALAGADAITLLGAFEVSDASGVGVTRVEIVPPAAYPTVTGTAAPNNATISVRQMRANVLVATVASVTLAVGTNLVAETPVNVPVVGTPVLLADDVLDVLLHQNGTGLAINVGLEVVVDIS